MEERAPDPVGAMARALRGDGEALCELLLATASRWAPGLSRALAIARGAYGSDDVLQQSLLKVLRASRPPQFVNEAAVHAWLRKVVRGELARVLRSLRTKKRSAAVRRLDTELVDGVLRAPGPGPRTEAELAEWRRVLRETIAATPILENRCLLQWSELDGLTVQQIAARWPQPVTIGALEKRLLRARKDLLRRLRQRWRGHS